MLIQSASIIITSTTIFITGIEKPSYVFNNQDYVDVANEYMEKINPPKNNIYQDIIYNTLLEELQKKKKTKNSVD